MEELSFNQLSIHREPSSVVQTVNNTTSQVLKVKVKSNHRSKFSNLSNWKEEA